MRFTCEKTALVQGLNIASRTVAQKSSLSVIEGILCKAGAGLSLTGYNMETAITFTIDADGVHTDNVTNVIPCSISSAYGYNNYQRELSINDSVIIYNNEIRSNSVETCRLYAYKLANIARAIDINVNAQKTPILLKGSESQMLTLKNVYLKYDGNQPVMMADKDLDLSGFTVLKTDAPFVAHDFKELHDAVWNEALTYLGICNVNIQKRARLITDEVLRSQGGTIASRYSRLNARQRAAEEINKMFDLNISVKFREGLSGEDPAFMFPDNRFDLQDDDGEEDKIG